MNLQHIFNHLNQVDGLPAVSAFITTHRTFPDHEQDPIALKNTLKEIEKKLSEEQEISNDQKTAILDQLKDALRDYDHRYNLNTLAIFATPDQAEVYKFPFNVEPRVIIDRSFATRDIIRELNHALHYYVVIVSRTQGRLLEVFNDQLVHEFGEEDQLQNLEFPHENTALYATNSGDRANASKEDNYLKEFLTRIDKSVQEVHNTHPLPIILVGDERNVALYEQLTEQPNIIIGKVTNSADLEAEARHIIEEVQPALDEYHHQKQIVTLSDMDQARDQNLLIEDLASIYRAANEGRVRQVFVRKGYIQPAVINTETLNVDPGRKAIDSASEYKSDDVVDDIINLAVKHGGQANFINTENFKESSGILAALRY